MTDPLPSAKTQEMFPAVDAGIDLNLFPARSTFLRVLGVNYVHLKTEQGDDMYITQHGAPFYRHLMPENWYEPTWFKEKRERLCGTGTVYKVPTKPLPGGLVESINIIVKWSRVGQDVPLDTFTLYKNINAEFNTPFEEFALLEELRRSEYGPRDLRILTQKPLAIYVPSERMQLWQTGRSREKILARISRRPGVEIDILRSYIMIYGWIDGIEAPEAYAKLNLAPKEQEGQLSALTHSVDLDLKKKGFAVVDHKPTHIILRMKNGLPRERPTGRISYAIVDYELLERTAANEDAVRSARRSEYLARQRDRFLPRSPTAFPENLRPCRIAGVDYVYGHTESTGGLLYVVGHDPDLFAYFLPERWRQKKVRLSEGGGQTYYTQTKDRIHLVWKVSRVGELPPHTGVPGRDKVFIEHGLNSPFEKFALAMEMSARGILTVYPRAIYMTGSADEVAAPAIDRRRFEAFRDVLSPDGKPVLPINHDYIVIWGYWRGREDAEAIADELLWTPIDVKQAAAKGIITNDTLEELIERHRATLAAAGFEDLNLKGDHILLSYIPEGAVKTNKDGQPELRHCNFELVRWCKS